MKLIKALLTAAILSFAAFACESDDPTEASSDPDTGQQVDVQADIDQQPDVISTSSDAGTDTEPDYWEVDCHYDCWASLSCRDGQVYSTSGGGPISCDDPDYDQKVAACDEEELVGECEQGCAETMDYHFDPTTADWNIVCEEGRPRVVGDSCESDEDCQPARQRTLVCDRDRETCVDQDQPDYLTWCGLADVDHWADNPTVFLAAPGCAAEYCLLQFPTEGEVCQGCSFPCESDADCPAGALCKHVPGLEARQAGPPAREVVKLCEPRADGLPDCR